jgi:hypothetical protein
MALTRATIEAVLIRRCGSLLTALGLDGTTAGGTNADLNDPIGWALRQMGVVLTTALTVADVDVELVASADYDQLLDLAELRTLETLLTHPDLVTVRVDDLQKNWSDLGKRIETAITRKRAQMARDYGTGLGTLTAGVIGLGFQEYYDTEDWA